MNFLHTSRVFCVFFIATTIFSSLTYGKSFSLDYIVKGKTLEAADESLTLFHHHLQLYGDFYSSDLLHLKGRFDILNDENFPYSTFGHSLDGALSSTSKQSLKMTHLYLEILGSLNRIKIGRFQDGFGLGLRYDDGSKGWTDWSDAAQFSFQAGHTLLSLEYGKRAYSAHHVFASSLERGLDDDAVKALKPDTFFTGKVLFSPSGALMAGVLYSKASTLDYKETTAYMKRSFSEDGYIGFELSSLKGGNLGANGFLLETSYHLGRGHNFRFWAGLASGDTSLGTDDKVESFYFNRNKSPTLVLFNYALAKKPEVSANKVSANNLYHFNVDRPWEFSTVTNAQYFSPRWFYQSNNYFLELAFTSASRLKTFSLGDVEYKKGSLGLEVDFAFNYQISNYFTTALKLGYFNSSDKMLESAYGVFTEISTTF